MDLYIFRHGQTYFSKNHIPYGDKVESAEILDEGIPVIKRLAEHLKKLPTDRNFTSPFLRCVKTSQIVSEITGKQFEVDQDLRDWDPRTEAVQQVINRILDFCKLLETKNQGSIAICTHGYPIGALISYFTKGKIEESDLPNYPNPGVLVTIESGKVGFKDFN